MFNLTDTKPLLPIADRFLNVPYDGDCYPGSAKSCGLDNGANCQQFAFEFIRSFGCIIPDFRSNHLWEDTDHTEIVTEILPLDLLLFNRTAEVWGAHVVVCVGKNQFLHLSKRIGFPAIESMEMLLHKPEYTCLIGTKRCKYRGNN